MVAIDPYTKYGLDGQYIHFDPAIPDLIIGDVITQDDGFQLRYAGEGNFQIYSQHHFITGYHLSKPWKILKYD